MAECINGFFSASTFDYRFDLTKKIYKEISTAFFLIFQLFKKKKILYEMKIMLNPLVIKVLNLNK